MPNPVLQNRTARGSTVISQPAVSGIGKPQVVAESGVSLRRIFFTSKDLTNPERAYEILYKLQDLLFQGLTPVLQNAMVVGNRLTGVTFTSGQTQYLSHGLGRPYQGYLCVRAQGGYPLFQEASFPSGVTSDKVLPLTSSNGGTFDFFVF